MSYSYYANVNTCLRTSCMAINRQTLLTISSQLRPHPNNQPLPQRTHLITDCKYSSVYCKFAGNESARTIVVMGVLWCRKAVSGKTISSVLVSGIRLHSSFIFALPYWLKSPFLFPTLAAHTREMWDETRGDMGTADISVSVT